MSKNALKDLPAIDTWRVTLGSAGSESMLRLGTKNVRISGPVLGLLIAASSALLDASPNALSPLKKAALQEAIEKATEAICS